MRREDRVGKIVEEEEINIKEEGVSKRAREIKIAWKKEHEERGT